MMSTAMFTQKIVVAILGTALQTSPPNVETDFVVLADARDYRHCHNQPRHSYCHKRDRLPVNWPPHSNSSRR